MTDYIPYKYGETSLPGKRLIVGKVGDPNPLKDERVHVLPLNKLRINESLYFAKDEMIHWQWKLAKSTALRYNRSKVDMFRFVETDSMLEIVRIK